MTVNEEGAVAEITEYDSVCDAVVHAVSVFKNADPLALPPLYHAIEVDALNRLCERSCIAIEFEFADVDVAIHGHEVIVT